ncbi:unnamed protein product [Candidula unifasciata]|uniref:Ferritin n=1 Tax=Candidula unifasciata TaxID=100452 RepID=A0A8S3YI96_9EUPU|nr:unnamed protein product [Candidula unifasciata]
MAVNVQLLLLLMYGMALLSPTEYSNVTNITPRCLQKTAGCARFQPPEHEVGEYKCTFNHNRCDFVCRLICPRQKNGLWMTLSNTHAGKDIYSCAATVWKRRDMPKGHCVAMVPVKEVSQNLHHTKELNKLVGSLWNSSYVYLAMASFYERADVALPGFSQLMTQLWEVEIKHARDFMSYINKRGGYIRLEDIPRPVSLDVLLMEASSRAGLVGLQTALNVTQDVNYQVLRLHSETTRRKHSDPHLKFYLEEGLLAHKTDTIKKLGDLIHQLASYPDEDYDLGEYLLDLQIGQGQGYGIPK